MIKGLWRDGVNTRALRCAIHDLPSGVDALTVLRGYLEYQVPTATRAVNMKVDHDGENIELSPGVKLSARIYQRGESGPVALEVTLDRSDDPTWVVGDPKSPLLAEVVMRKDKSETRLVPQSAPETTATPTGWRITFSPERRNPKDVDQPLDCTFHLVMNFEEGRAHFEANDIHLND